MVGDSSNNMSDCTAIVTIEDVPDPCEGDFDGDGDVDNEDLVKFAENFGRTNCFVPGVPPCLGDFDHDGDVDGSDLVVFKTDLGRTNCP